MSLFFITDARFFITPDGTIYSGEYSFSDILWQRYIDFFGEVKVIGRLFSIEEFDKKEHQVTNVDILPLPAFDNPLQFYFRQNEIKKLLENYYKIYSPNSIIIRGAGAIGYLASKFCFKNKILYGIEVIGDPYDVFAPGVIKHPLRPVFRSLFTKHQKNAVKNASSAIYVTSNKLQQKYPANKIAFQTYASDVVINEMVQNYKILDSNNDLKIISIGSLEQMYKGPDVLLKAIKELINQKITVSLTWLGHGKYLEEMLDLARDLNIIEYVDFKGSVDAITLIKYLDESDVFVLASRTEGLPRAIVEAMARALPCIGSNVGGIPELINEDLLFMSENYLELASKIKLLFSDSEFYEKSSKYSLEKSSEFRQEILEERRLSFFKSI